MRWLGISLLVAVSAVAIPALADDDALDAPQPRATIRVHTYTLAECLALAERNHPNLWAARARLAYARAQLNEAQYTPFFAGWGVNATGGVLPQITGSSFFTSSLITTKNISGLGGLAPFASIDFTGVIPLYTFGKITNAIDAADANVRVNEWDLEKYRQQTRMDVRRAYFGVQFARDAKVVIADALDRLKKGVDGIKRKAEHGDRGVQPTDVYRLEAYYEEINARSGDPVKGETFALAALRFMTGVQTSFDVVDEPLKRPDRPLVAVTQYLSAARLFRPEINMARAGVVARERFVDYSRARYFPDFGIGFGFSYATAPSSTQQISAWTGGDPFNHFGYAAAFGMRWSLDAITNSARVAEAESSLEETRALERLAFGGVMVEVENAHGTAVEAKNREEAWARAEDKGKQWIATVQDSIDLGTADERALLEPLRVWGNARINHLQALMDLNLALSDLARASGWDGSAPTGG